MGDLVSALNWGDSLRKAFSGDPDAYNQEYARLSRRDALLADAQARRQKAMAEEQTPEAFQKLGLSPDQASALTTVFRAGIDPTKLSGYQGDVQGQGFRQAAVDALSGGDYLKGNAYLAGVQGAPLQVSKVEDGVALNPYVAPDQNSFNPTAVGQSTINQHNASASASRASAQAALGRLAIAQQQAALQQSGNWAPGRNFAAAGGATGAAATKKSGDELKAAFANQGLAQDAYNFAGALLGKKPEDVQKMTAQQIRDAVAAGGRWSSGPILGRTPGIGPVFNSDLEAYANSAAGKQARLNNPTGPVTNADFDVARKSVFSPDKPASVNADLLYQALSRVGSGEAVPQAPVAPVRRAVNPTTGKAIILVNGQWVPE